MSRKLDALELIEKARQHSAGILDHIPEGEWFRMPREGVTHVAWQVGHIALSQYRLGLERVRGKRPEDDDLIPPTYVGLFGKGTTPAPDPGAYPPTSEIRAVYDAVHSRLRAELPDFDDRLLDLPPEGTPHRRFATRLGALNWCAQHEMLHAGQIGLLRRLFGADPIW